MKIVKPWVEIPEIDGIKIMRTLERAAKQCYRSQGNITDESYDHFLRNCISRGHESVLEHEKITVRIYSDIGSYKDLTRHRHASFSVESTRYCNYSKDKFGSEISFIDPCHIEDEEMYKIWKETMENIEKNYNLMAEKGALPDQLRMMLPHSTAAEYVMTANIREWRHIFSLRAVKHTHPTVQQIMIPLLLHLKKEMPALFDEIEYNEEFDKSKYAEIKIVK